MTGLGVERTPRTAYRLSFVAPVGTSTPMPPHIQGAERRSESRTRRHTGVRWGLRVLVVGGLAGAAWMLTGSAAQAADRADGSDGSLLGSVPDADAMSPVTDLLEAAAQPLENFVPAHHERHVTADILDVPRPAFARPTGTLDDVAHDPSGTTVDILFDVEDRRHDAEAPDRLT